MPRIHLLPDSLVSQIAAGEVVERPASVVKELIENALDAGAGEVRIELEGGGKRRITVADDGGGLGRDDALLAFDRHATSKIGSFEDLERVGTLGFRGEALASIAAVSRVELVTAEAPGDGTRVRIEGGRVRVAEPTARARGTTLEVASLFWNVPARRKFLKSPATELRRSVEVVQGYALARPDVRFRIAHEGRLLLETLAAAGGASAVEAARRRIGEIFGAPFAGALAAIPQGSVEEGPAGERIAGFVGGPATSRGRRSFVFVNRRLLRDRAILAVFYRSVRDEWKSEDFPSLFLFLDVPAEEVDVNVHPQKAEVRFRDPGLLHRVEAALRRGLDRARGEEPAPLREPSAPPSIPFAWQGLGERRRSLGVGPEGGSWEVREGAAEDATPGMHAPRRLAEPVYAPLERVPVPLSGRSGEARPFRLLGQYKGTLILLEGPDGLYLIDQHVAHERILYERLRRDLGRGRPASQALLDPLLLDLAPAERLRLEELAPRLDEHGFSISPLSGGSLAVSAVPAALAADEAERLLRQLAAEDDGNGAPEVLVRRILAARAATLACKAAVKMHHPLSAPEMEGLVDELFRAENPYACPHGRPIVLAMSDSDLERRFGRR